jgi:hypothetical protein
MFHPAGFTDGQTLAGGLKFLLADIGLLAGFKALGRSLVRSGHGAVALHVFLNFFCRMLRYNIHSKQ